MRSWFKRTGRSLAHDVHRQTPKCVGFSSFSRCQDVQSFARRRHSHEIRSFLALLSPERWKNFQHSAPSPDQIRLWGGLKRRNRGRGGNYFDGGAERDRPGQQRSPKCERRANQRACLSLNRNSSGRGSVSIPTARSRRFLVEREAQFPAAVARLNALV